MKQWITEHALLVKVIAIILAMTITATASVIITTNVLQGEQGPAGEQGSPGEKGDGIASISKTNTEGLVDTYTITYTNGETTTFTVTNGSAGEQGIQGIQGEKGEDGRTPVITIQNGNWYIDGVDTGKSADGIKGNTGNGISAIAKTSTDGLVDTYTITFTNGTTTTFTVTNGANGAQGAQGIQGIKGEKGEDGHTPIITIQNGNWYIDGADTGKSADGIKGDTGNGISKIEKTGTEGLVDTYTITYTNGDTSSFTVTNGAQGIQGIQGQKGDDGHSPVITIQDGYWYIDGVPTNESASEGIKGDTGNGISSIAKTGTEGLVDTYTITYTNGDTTTFTVTNGAQGQQGIQGIQGVPGKDGNTPTITIQGGYWYINDVNTNQSAAGLKGDTGNGISKIEKTGTEGLVDTYTITYTNGDTTTFTVTNGAQGQQGIQGIQGVPGKDGETPVITIQNGNWYINGVDTGKTAEGVKGDDGLSAFEIYQKYHPEYTGTEAEWIESLKGSDGAQGEQGVSVVNAYVDAELHLWIELSNGTKIDAGYVGVTVNPPVTTYTVTFKDWDGTTLKTQSGIESGGSATAPANPTRDGYTFIGWDGDFSNVTSNIVITAKYNEPPKFIVSTATASAGETDVVVTVSIKNNPGILGMILKLNYDDTALTLTKASKGAALYSHSLTKPGVFVDGCNFVVDTMQLEDEDMEDGVILTVKFTVNSTAAVGDYNIQISYETNAIKDGNNLPINNIIVENGKIVVQ